MSTQDSKIVAAVGTASAAMTPRHGSLAKRLEKAMADAVRDAMAQGVSVYDTDTLRNRMQAARAAILAEQ